HDDAFIIISTSGIRPVVVEMALGAKSRSLSVIAIVSRSHCDAAQPAHSSGKKLTDLADIVIDNLSPVGDCAVELNGLDWRTGPLSTVTGSVIINTIRCETARMLVEGGHKPVMLPSHQFVGNETAEDQLEKYYEAYRRSLRHLYE
ncbi:MAG: sugar isomerase domain-containing protein, partial [Candidatus Acidiferrales bacterium]